MELYAIRYAKDFAYNQEEIVFADSKGSKKPLDFDFLIYAATSDQGLVVFDTGFRDPDEAKGYGITLIDVEEELRQVFGSILKPHTLFITHAHFDHLHNLDIFAPQEIVMSRAEHAFALEKDEPDHIKALLRTGPVRLFDCETDLPGGFRAQVIGGHTPGSAVVYFQHGGKTYVLTGDECYYNQNLTQNRPNGNCTDPQANAAFLDREYRKGTIPLCCHDPAILQSYPKVSPNIARIV